MSIMTPEQNPPDGPVILSYGQLVLWSLALAFLGVFCAVPLRTQTILKEKLKFPSGTATANVIRTLHAVPEAEEAPEPLHRVDIIPEDSGEPSVVVNDAVLVSCFCTSSASEPVNPQIQDWCAKASCWNGVNACTIHSCTC